MKKKWKSIFGRNKNISIGVVSFITVASIATPLVIVLTKNKNAAGQNDSVSGNQVTNNNGNNNHSNNKLVKLPIASLHYKNDLVRSSVFKLITNPLLVGFVAKSSPAAHELITKKEKQDALTLLSSQLLQTGLNDVKFKDLEIVLNNLKVKPSLINIIKNSLFKNGNIDTDFLNLIFNEGVANINKLKYSKQKDLVFNLMKQFLPISFSNLVSQDVMQKIIFTGLSEIEFKNLIIKIAKEKSELGSTIIDLAAGIIEADIKKIYSFLPILNRGIINATQNDWKNTLVHLKDLVNYKIFGKELMSLFVEDDIYKQNSWQTSNIIKNIANQINKLSITTDKTKNSPIDDAASLLFNLFNKGMNSIDQNQVKQFTNIISWAMNFKQGQIYDQDLNHFKGIIIKQFDNLTDQNNKMLDFSKIKQAKSIKEIVVEAKKLKPFKKHNNKLIEKVSVSGYDIYKTLNSNRIVEHDITANQKNGFFSFKPNNYGLKISLGEILKKYFDENGKKLSKNHPAILKVYREMQKDKERSNDNIYKWWDKLIDAANSIKAYDSKGKRIKIDWLKELKNLGEKSKAVLSGQMQYQPYKDYFVFVNAFLNKVKKKKYYLSNDPKLDDRISSENFKEEIKTFKVQAFLDKINKLSQNGLYTSKIFDYKVNLNDKIENLVKENINKYHYHQRNEETINQYKKKVKDLFSTYQTRSSSEPGSSLIKLNLNSLEDSKLEGVKQVYEQAKKILKSTKHGLYDKNNQLLNISEENIPKIIPAIPPRDYAYNLDSSSLNAQININKSVTTKLTYFALSNTKVLSDFFIHGYPRTAEKEQIFENVIKELFYLLEDFLTNNKGQKMISNIAVNFVKIIFENVKKQREIDKKELSKIFIGLKADDFNKIYSKEVISKLFSNENSLVTNQKKQEIKDVIKLKTNHIGVKYLLNNLDASFSAREKSLVVDLSINIDNKNATKKLIFQNLIK